MRKKISYTLRKDNSIHHLLSYQIGLGYIISDHGWEDAQENTDSVFQLSIMDYMVQQGRNEILAQWSKI